jgi:hypothetical protein
MTTPKNTQTTISLSEALRLHDLAKAQHEERKRKSREARRRCDEVLAVLERAAQAHAAGQQGGG